MQDSAYATNLYDAATAELKVPPHSVEAEQALLGGLTLDNATWDQVADKVTEADFYRREHRLLFRRSAISRPKARLSISSPSPSAWKPAGNCNRRAAWPIWAC